MLLRYRCVGWPIDRTAQLAEAIEAIPGIENVQYDSSHVKAQFDGSRQIRRAADNVYDALIAKDDQK